MPDPRHGIESPCRPADLQPDRVPRAGAMPIHRATSNVFDSPEQAVERFGDALPRIGGFGNLGNARRRTVRVTMRRQPSRDRSRAAGMQRDHARPSSGTEALDDIARDLDRAPTKAAG